MLRSKLLTAFSLSVLLAGAAGVTRADDLIAVTESLNNADLSAEILPLVDEPLDIRLRVRNERIEIRASLVGDNDDQRENIEFSRDDGDDGDDDFASFVDVRVHGTDRDDMIDIEFRETIDQGIMSLQVLAGNGADTIRVFNRDDRVEQRIMPPVVLGDEESQLYLVLKGGSGDDSIVNDTRAFTFQEGGLGWDQMHGGLGADHFFSEGRLEQVAGPSMVPVTIADQELDYITDAGGTATVTRFAVPAIAAMTTLHRPVLGTTGIDLLDALKKNPIVSKGKLDRAGVIPGTTIPLPDQMIKTRPTKGDSVEAYAIKTTFRWELLDEFAVDIDPTRIRYNTFFVKPVDEALLGMTFLDYVDNTIQRDWESEAPELEPTIEEL